MSFSIKKNLSRLLPEGDKIVRIEEITGKGKADGDADSVKPQVTFKATVIGGEEDGTTVYINRYLTPKAIGILCADLANTGAFDLNDPEDEELDEDPEILARQLASRMVGKTYRVSYKHGKPTQDGRVFPDIRILEPYSSY